MISPAAAPIKTLTRGIFGALALSFITAHPALSEPKDAIEWPDVVEARTYEELNKKWCAAARDKTHVFILPASLFVDARELSCDTGPYRMYRILPPDDTGDFLYFIDPPFGAENRLGCDGKAGVKIQVVAVNCRPE